MDHFKYLAFHDDDEIIFPKKVDTNSKILTNKINPMVLHQSGQFCHLHVLWNTKIYSKTGHSVASLHVNLYSTTMY